MRIYRDPATRLPDASYKSKTYGASWASTAAIKTSIATRTGSGHYSGAALDGSIGGSVIDLPQRITVTTVTGSGNPFLISNPIVIIGLDYFGQMISDNIYLTLIGGGETVSSLRGFQSVQDIFVPTMNNTNGFFTFGVGDIVLPFTAAYIRTKVAGTLNVEYDDGTFDDVDFGALDEQRTAAKIIKASSTGFPIGIYLDA